MVLHALHLCSGYGGFELGLKLAGVECRTVAHVERDAYAAATLVARMEDEMLDLAPVWSDLSTFDPDPFAGRVDLVTAGLPCQPFSGAGQQRGRDDGRHLWPMAERVIAHLGPRFVLLENVPDVVLPKYRWLEHVLSSLATLGFDAEWGVLSAAAVGAPHERERFWLLGYPNSERRATLPSSSSSSQGTVRADPDHRPDHPSEDVGHPDGGRLEGIGERDAGGRTRGPRRDTDRSDHPDPVAGGQWPPAQDDRAGWERWSSSGGPQPALRRSTHGRPPGLADALHLGGNGLVPAVAATALLELARRAGVILR